MDTCYAMTEQTFTTSPEGKGECLEVDLWTEDSDCGEAPEDDDLSSWMNGTMDLPSTDTVLDAGAVVWAAATRAEPEEAPLAANCGRWIRSSCGRWTPVDVDVAVVVTEAPTVSTPGGGLGLLAEKEEKEEEQKEKDKDKAKETEQKE